MIASWLLLALGAASAVAAFAALVPLTRWYYLSLLWFSLGWPLVDLVRIAVPLQVTAAAVLLAVGGWRPPGVVGLVALAGGWAMLARVTLVSRRTPAVIAAALADASRSDLLPPLPPPTAPDRRLLRHPFRRAADGVQVIPDLPYAPLGPRTMVDVRRPAGGVTGAPVLVHLHGGAWVTGSRKEQGLPLLNALVRRGWVTVSIGYRLCPRVRLADQVADVRAGIAWVREHIEEYGGDPRFVAGAGGSAGGQLISLVGLDRDRPLDAVVSLYGAVDLLNSNRSRRGRDSAGFLRRFVVGSDPETDRAAWEQLSPLAQVRVEAPPFFVLHGRNDSMLPVADARHFVSALRAVSLQPVVYAELPGAQHQFEMLTTYRALAAVDGVVRFLEALAAGRS